jgi:heme o synthase
VKDSQVAATANAVPIIATRRAPSVLADYIELTKPRLNGLVVATSAAGFYLGTAGSVDIIHMLFAVAGTALVAGGAAVLNQVSERESDALMRRTRLRPLPDGRVAPGDAWIFGLLLSASGVALLAARTNPRAAALALGTLVVYLMVYTPMKRRTPLSTLVGALPGALPALIGWTAAHDHVAAGGAALFAIVFLWQIPHFMAISWLYRDDYQKAGFPLLTVIDPGGRRAGRQAVLFAAALLPVAVVPSLIRVSGAASGVVAVVLGTALLCLAVAFARTRTDESARRLFFGSIVYLPILWMALIADKL